MNSASIFKISTDGPAATIRFGKQVGTKLNGGEVIELAGDLGSGKTTFMKGILGGLGYTGEVPSPTYTISRVYGVRKNIELFHFDFYRVKGADIVTSELSEVLDEPAAIVAVEWHSNIGDHILPYDRLKISFEPGVEVDDRVITVQALGQKYQWVIEELVREPVD